MSDGRPTFDTLTDEELLGLRVAAACLNEVDKRLSRRGRLDMRTGVLT